MPEETSGAVTASVAALRDALIAAGRYFDRRGWVPATGGNFSARVDTGRLLMTASGVHKGELVADDLLLTDLDGRPLASTRKTSYETGLHLQLYRMAPAIGAVLHVHTVANTVLSQSDASLRLRGYELLKVLPGVSDPQAEVEIPVFGNDQDIARLSRQVDDWFREHSAPGAYLIAGHGLYAWGESVAQARHRVEALEFILECELRKRAWR